MIYGLGDKRFVRRLVSEDPREESEEPPTYHIDRALSDYVRRVEETREETCEGSLRIRLLDYRQNGGDFGVLKTV